jgi:hypothetical protein
VHACRRCSCACDGNGRNSDAGLDQFDDLMGVVGVGFEFGAGQEAVRKGSVADVAKVVKIEFVTELALGVTVERLVDSLQQARQRNFKLIHNQTFVCWLHPQPTRFEPTVRASVKK